MAEWKWSKSGMLSSPGVSIYGDDDADYYVPPKPDLTDEEQQWLNLLHKSKGDPGLTDLVEKCKVYFVLRKD